MGKGILEIQVPSASAMFGIKWKNPEAVGYIDVFDTHCFAEEGNLSELLHRVITPGRRVDHARCSVRIDGRIADLDYSAFEAENNAKGWYIGVLRLHFADQRRDRIVKAEWKDKGRRDFCELPHKILDPILPIKPPYQRPGRIEKKPTTTSLRQQQNRFKLELVLVYGCCCITQCRIAEALEAAHIDPYKGPASNHIQNGLLLRSDIHALFDSELIGIEPSTRAVRFAEPARSFPEYLAIDSKNMTIALPNCPAYGPSIDALQRRWVKFQKRWS